MSTNPSDNLQSTPKGGNATAETGQAPFLEPNTSYSDSSANSITQQSCGKKSVQEFKRKVYFLMNIHAVVITIIIGE